MTAVKLKENHIYHGDAREILTEFPTECIDCVMTSPPYWALRDYGRKGQLGLESNFNEYISKLCDIFDEVRRVLKQQGTCWVNLGDTYYTKSGTGFRDDRLSGNKSLVNGLTKAQEARGRGFLSDKCLTLIPFRFALEMVNRGWILRNVIVWYKPNCMPSSVQDRFTVDFEYLFFFVKSKRYYFKRQFEPHLSASIKRMKKGFSPNSSFNYQDRKKYKHYSLRRLHGGRKDADVYNPLGRNKRCVWTINTKPFKENHFAVYPQELCEIPIKAGCPKNGIVLDPFFGAGTTGLVARKQGKQFIGIELNSSYIKIAKRRIVNGS